MVEYVVVAGTVVAAMLAPVFNGKNAIELLENAVSKNYQGYSYAVSLSEYPDYLPANKLNQAGQDAAALLDKYKDYTSPNFGVPSSFPTLTICNDWSKFPAGC